MTPRRQSISILVSLLSLVAIATSARAQYLLEDAHDPKRYEPDFSGIPFVYYADEFKFAGGLAGGGSGLLQPQTTYFGALLAGVNGSYGGVFGLYDVQLKPIDRLFLDFDLAYFHYPDLQSYVPGNPHFPGQLAGNNQSSLENNLHPRVYDFSGDVGFRFLLPIGGGRDNLINHYRLENGLYQSGGSGSRGWNPLDSGRTFLQATPFFEYDKLNDNNLTQSFNCAGVRLGGLYDNTDFELNPTRGNRTSFTVNRNLGIFGGGSPWTAVEGGYSQFVPLGTSEIFKQEVLALDTWTCYSPTWHSDGPLDPTPRGAPPFYEGANLGGMDRLRGFDQFRFHDRAALYGAMELRLIPYWNPLSKIKLLKSQDLPWMQWVLFAECGKVANRYVPSDLFSQMKVDGGIGVRVLAKDQLVRFDLAFSEEGVYFWAMLDQTF